MNLPETILDQPEHFRQHLLDFLSPLKNSLLQPARTS
jgi:hypothetical protein